jgi:hypothetical protein
MIKRRGIKMLREDIGVRKALGRARRRDKRIGDGSHFDFGVICFEEGWVLAMTLNRELEKMGGKDET